MYVIHIYYGGVDNYIKFVMLSSKNVVDVNNGYLFFFFFLYVSYILVVTSGKKLSGFLGELVTSDPELLGLITCSLLS